ncbi:MAG TPA: CPBP family intramembrane glutamic endopeptidase [Pirellulales bacterium]|jgi:membrane protease YdiL (CAAX protease family)|nr:CPBP family intramembrane glutamic endopeptidase [Pirellulales bacterium]
MTSQAEHPDVFHPTEQPPVPRGHPWIAWAAIVAVVAGLVALRANTEIPGRQDVQHRLQSMAADFQARYFLGAANLFQQKESEALLASAAVGRGPIGERLRYVVLLGELQGPKAAAEKLKKLADPLHGTGAKEDRDAADVLDRLYGDLTEGKTTLPSIGPEDRQRLVERLGWSGRLALHPAGGTDLKERDALLAAARQTVIRSLASFGIGAIAVLAGLVALAVIVLLLLARPQSRALPQSTGHGGIYAETFAVWIVTYITLGYSARCLSLEQHPFLLSAAVMFVSLATLGWPVLRGVPWQTVRQDVGLHLGRKPLVELLLGPVAYLAALPLAIGGLLIVAALMVFTHRLPNAGGGELAPDRMPYHPVVGWLLEGDWWEKVQVVFLASVMAPLMEETLFRGFLHRQLRDATHRLGYVGSVLASGLTTSFVFAAIHPQGWIAIPALMGLALAFTLAREWRGTLLPAMIAHGLNNGLLTCVFISMGSG